MVCAEFPMVLKWNYFFPIENIFSPNSLCLWIFPIHYRIEKLGFLKSPSLISYFVELQEESFRHSLFAGEIGVRNLWLNCQFSRKRNVIHVTILFAGVILAPTPLNYIWNKPNLFANASLCSDSFQYAKIFSESLINSDFFLNFWDRPWYFD